MDSTGTAVRSVAGPLQREAGAVGRQGRLELTFAVRGGRTVLTHGYAEPPFRVGRTFAWGHAGGLHMILTTVAPGVFGGDSLSQVIRVEPGARVLLTSQSSLQAHPSADGASAQLHSVYEIGDDAGLTCHWDPLIPFAFARLDQQIDLQLSPTSALYWSDAFMSGREGRGERWQFEALAYELRLCRAGSLEYLERYRITPAARSPRHPWIAADAAYVGTVVSAGPSFSSTLADQLHGVCSALDGLRAAVDCLDDRILIARLLGSSGPPFHLARRTLFERLGG